MTSDHAESIETREGTTTPADLDQGSPRGIAATAPRVGEMAGTTTPVFAAWNTGLFVESDVSRRVQSIIRSGRGGNYGLTAPRGSGKSWLLNEATKWAAEANGLGVLFPSPSKDTPDAFLAALSEVFAQSYIDDYTRKRPLSLTVVDRQRRFYLTTLSILVGYAGIGLIVLGILDKHLPKISGFFYTGIFLLLGSLGALFYLSGRLRRKPASTYERAIEFRRQARFSTALSASSELSGSLSHAGTSLGLRKTRGEQFTERPVTLSSLVHGFREFCKTVVEAVDGPVVIAIDELDKIENPQDVIELLRAIKGIFDIWGVHYFVSVSDEAARRLDLGGVRDRNEFNSSFYQVFNLPQAGANMIGDMLSKRGIKDLSPEEITAVAILSGGVSREAIRLVDVLANIDGTHVPTGDWNQYCFTILTSESASFREEVEGAKDENINDDDRAYVGTAADELLYKKLDNYRLLWMVDKRSEAFRSKYTKEFRRLLNRILVGKCVTSSLTPEDIVTLQQVIIANERDPTVGKDALIDWIKKTGHSGWDFLTGS